MYVKLNGEMVYLWRAIDHECEILESYVARTRDKTAALRFRQMKSLQKFASVHANVYNHFQPGTPSYRQGELQGLPLSCLS